MAYEKREGSGVIFKNDKKGNEKAPDYSGTAFFNGKDVKVALWVKEGAKGKFFSMKIEESAAPAENAKAAEKEDDSDSLPF